MDILAFLLKKIVRLLSHLGLAMVFAFVFVALVGNMANVMGVSMEPTLHEKDIVFNNKLSFRLHGLDHGDIVVTKDVDTTGLYYIKRVIALEGDDVLISGGKVFVNDVMIEEDYTSEYPYTYIHEDGKWAVGEDEVFILGDNRNKHMSKDSRYFGSIPYGSIVGKVTHKIYPKYERYK